MGGATAETRRRRRIAGRTLMAAVGLIGALAVGGEPARAESSPATVPTTVTAPVRIATGQSAPLPRGLRLETPPAARIAAPDGINPPERPGQGPRVASSPALRPAHLVAPPPAPGRIPRDARFGAPDVSPSPPRRPGAKPAARPAATSHATPAVAMRVVALIAPAFRPASRSDAPA